MKTKYNTIKIAKNIFASMAVGLILGIPNVVNAEAHNFTTYNFTTINVPNSVSSAVNGSSTHAIVGEYDGIDEKTHGFILDDEVYTTVDIPDASLTVINGINASGQIIGTYSTTPTKPHAFVKNKDAITTLDPPNSVRSQGGFINAKGEAVGAYRTADQKRHGFLWRKGEFTTFNVPNDHPLFGTVPLGNNDLGQVVGNYVDINGGVDAGGNVSPNIGRHGFLLSDGIYTTLDVPGASFTVAQGINNEGKIVGLYFDINGNEHGFVLSNGTYTTVDAPNATATAVYTINAKGEIGGVYTDTHNVDHGFVGTPSHH